MDQVVEPAAAQDMPAARSIAAMTSVKTTRTMDDNKQTRQDKNNLDHIKVAVRLRPFTDKERQRSSKRIVDIEQNTVALYSPKAPNEIKKFTFDYSYWSHDGFKRNQEGVNVPDPEHRNSAKYVGQERVFDDLGHFLLENALQGYNSALLAYGQTGSGKSYTVSGYGQNEGILPRFARELFAELERRLEQVAGRQNSESEHKEEATSFEQHAPGSAHKSRRGPGSARTRKKKNRFEVYFSMIEIYNEVVRDLLAKQTGGGGGGGGQGTGGTFGAGSTLRRGLRVREHPKRGFFVESLTSIECANKEAIERLIEVGQLNKSIAATSMNETSSRGHTIYEFHIRQYRSKPNTEPSDDASAQRRPEVDTLTTSVVQLVDLAGSERTTVHTGVGSSSGPPGGAPSQHGGRSASPSPATSGRPGGVPGPPQPARTPTRKRMQANFAASHSGSSAHTTTTITATSSASKTTSLRRFRPQQSQQQQQQQVSNSLGPLNLMTGNHQQRFKESVSINQSLSALGNCIQVLSQYSQQQQQLTGPTGSGGSGGDQSSSKQPKIPYRDSVLTKLLNRCCLSGNSKVVLIATLSPAEGNYDDTLSTLRFADRAKQIRTHALINRSQRSIGGGVGGEAMSVLQRENERLKQILDGRPTRSDDSSQTSNFDDEKIREEEEDGDGDEGADEEEEEEDEEVEDKEKQKVEAKEDKRDEIEKVNEMEQPSREQPSKERPKPQHQLTTEEGAHEDEEQYQSKLMEDTYVFATPIAETNALAKEMGIKVTYGLKILTGKEQMLLNTGSGQQEDEDDDVDNDPLIDYDEQPNIQVPVNGEPGEGLSDELGAGLEQDTPPPVVSEGESALKPRTLDIPPELYVHVHLDEFEGVDFYWSKEKFQERRAKMLELYGAWDVGGKSGLVEHLIEQSKYEGYYMIDPFVDDLRSSFVLIGHAQVTLRPLGHMSQLLDNFEILDVNDEVVGQVRVEVSPCRVAEMRPEEDVEVELTYEKLSQEELARDYLESSSDLLGKRLVFLLEIVSCSRVPQRFARIFCQYTLNREQPVVRTKLTRIADARPGGGRQVDPQLQFNHRHFVVIDEVTPELLAFFQHGFVTIQLVGQYDLKQIQTRPQPLPPVDQVAAAATATVPTQATNSKAQSASGSVQSGSSASGSSVAHPTLISTIISSINMYRFRMEQQQAAAAAAAETEAAASLVTSGSYSGAPGASSMNQYNPQQQQQHGYANSLTDSTKSGGGDGPSGYRGSSSHNMMMISNSGASSVTSASATINLFDQQQDDDDRGSGSLNGTSQENIIDMILTKRKLDRAENQLHYIKRTINIAEHYNKKHIPVRTVKKLLNSYGQELESGSLEEMAAEVATTETSKSAPSKSSNCSIQ